jgi:acetyltransferase
VARYTPTDVSEVAEFAVVVADDWQRFGLATSLMHIVILAAALAGYVRLDGIILRENSAMRALATSLGFTPVKGSDEGPGVFRVRKYLGTS